ncbi:MAG: peroxidase [Planctomycetes bacterium]|nr:peroxidase [Planctomycetota bacterium]
MSALELSDIQGTVLRGRPMPYYGTYLVFTVQNPRSALTLLERLLPKVTTAADWEAPAENAWINVAFSHAGLSKLGLPEDVLSGFPREVRQGMAARSAFLGDVGSSAPENWDMPHAGNGLDIGLLIMAGSIALRDDKIAIGHAAVSGLPGIVAAHRLDVGLPPTMREHFGFVDGISRPYIEGQGGTPLPGQPIAKAGEFVLGYENELGEIASGPGPQELWRNGTYIALRKLHQDVAAFRRFLRDNANSPEGQELLAAQMMGRWRSGCPLAKSPERDDPAMANDPLRNNDFLYLKEDPDGRVTPAGSHIRRANPRDALDGTVVDMKLHRLLRRGSAYGGVLPEGVMEDDGADRGLVIALINANPGRQFEFVQSQWMNDGDFISEGDRTDPFAGRKDKADDFVTLKPRKRYRGLSQFATTRGGEHLFLPGIGGLKWILGNVKPA